MINTKDRCKAAQDEQEGASKRNPCQQIEASKPAFQHRHQQVMGTTKQAAIHDCLVRPRNGSTHPVSVARHAFQPRSQCRSTSYSFYGVHAQALTRNILQRRRWFKGLRTLYKQRVYLLYVNLTASSKVAQ